MLTIDKVPALKINDATDILSPRLPRHGPYPHQMPLSLRLDFVICVELTVRASTMASVMHSIRKCKLSLPASKHTLIDEGCCLLELEMAEQFVGVALRQGAVPSQCRVSCRRQ